MVHEHIHHTVLRVHRDRIEEVAVVWRRLEEALCAEDESAIRLAHYDAWLTEWRWNRADQDSELRDRSSVDPAILSRWREAPALLGPEWAETAERLAAALARLPAMVPRACAVMLNRSLKRLCRLIDLHAPGFSIENEGEIALRIIEEMHQEAALPEPEPEMDGKGPHPEVREKEFEDTLHWLLHRCMIQHEPRSGALDLGLGPAVMQVPALKAAVAGRPLTELADDWRRDRQRLEVWAHPSLLPAARLVERPERGAAIRLSCGLGEAGPIAWATGDALIAYAAQIRGPQGFDRPLSAALRRLGDALAEIADEGQGIIAWLEYQHPEAEGHRPFFDYEPPENDD
jgi:hypothetical protein